VVATPQLIIIFFSTISSDFVIPGCNYSASPITICLHKGLQSIGLLV